MQCWGFKDIGFDLVGLSCETDCDGYFVGCTLWEYIVDFSGQACG